MEAAVRQIIGEYVIDTREGYCALEWEGCAYGVADYARTHGSYSDADFGVITGYLKGSFTRHQYSAEQIKAILFERGVEPIPAEVMKVYTEEMLNKFKDVLTVENKRRIILFSKGFVDE